MSHNPSVIAAEHKRLVNAALEMKSSEVKAQKGSGYVKSNRRSYYCLNSPARPVLTGLSGQQRAT
jgi:hypothetical protein